MGLWLVAWLGSVSRGTTWPERRCKPRGFPFPPGGLRAEAPDVAALGRQRSFNRRPGTHVSRAPLLFKAPTQGQPWAHIGGGDSRGGRGRDRAHVGSAGRGLNQVTQCTGLESISGTQCGDSSVWKRNSLPWREGRGISTASGRVGLGEGYGKGVSLQQRGWEQFLLAKHDRVFW